MKNMLSIINDNTQLVQTAKENIDEFQHRLLDKMRPNTRRAKESDLKFYNAFCQQSELPNFSPDFKVAKDVTYEYIDFMVAAGLSKNTIKRRLSTISSMYLLVEFKNPLKESKNITDYVKASVREMQGPSQVAPIRHSDLRHLPQVHEDSTLIEIRDVMIAYLGMYSLCRASELLAIRVEDIDFNQGTLYVPRAKNDQQGEGRFSNLSSKTVALVEMYQAKSGIKSGFLIRRVFKSGKLGDTLSYPGLTKIIKRMGAQLYTDSTGINTHSFRVGSAVSLAEQGVSITEIAQAGGWKTATMPLRYTRQADAKTTGTARFID